MDRKGISGGQKEFISGYPAPVDHGARHPAGHAVCASVSGIVYYFKPCNPIMNFHRPVFYQKSVFGKAVRQYRIISFIVSAGKNRISGSRRMEQVRHGIVKIESDSSRGRRQTNGKPADLTVKCIVKAIPRYIGRIQNRRATRLPKGDPETISLTGIIDGTEATGLQGCRQPSPKEKFLPFHRWVG